MIRTLPLVALMLTACTGEGPNLPSLADPMSLFTITEAERVLGEPAHLSDSSTTAEAGLRQYSCAFTADTVDAAGKRGNVYFMFEEYDEVRSAEKAYRKIYRSNKGHDGVEVIGDLADEAYFHSDSENFSFLLVRKGHRMLRLKVNKLTAHTSHNEFHAVTREIAAEI